ADTAQALETLGIGFMFAPMHHAAMKHAAPVRKELGVRTLFNILGPLTNPAGAQNQVMGVFHPDLVGIQARVLQRLGSRHVLVVHALDGMDEISLARETMVGELVNGEIREYSIHPAQFGLNMAPLQSLQVRDKEQAKAMLLSALDNEPGAARDIVAFNAAAAIYAADIAPTLAAGIETARETLASGAARAKLNQFIEFSNRFKTA
ncbi:MAG: anthranilate phosphoribosyltransferase, partial [Burkholderiales bacterium]